MTKYCTGQTWQNALWHHEYVIARQGLQSLIGLLLYVLGGLAEEVDEKVLHAAFVPFGDLLDIQIPIDYETGEWQNPGK